MNDRALKVLEQYDLELISSRRGRGSYILETTQGLRILSDYTGTEGRALFQNSVMNTVRSGGYEHVDLILPNKEGGLMVRDREENRYVVRHWYIGRECDTSNESEVLTAVENLARLHRLMHVPRDETASTGFTAPAPADELHAQNAELRKIRSFVRKRAEKCDFERLLLQSFDHYYEQASEAEALAAYHLDCAAPGDAVCHGDYNQHHVLICGYEIATTDFDCCKYDIQINDLYRFMRKILEKHDWNQRLGMRMLERYHAERPIPPQERSLLYIRMLYPEKFRKLANHYYGSSKAWISGRYLEKLEKLNRQEAARLRFVRLLH
jgi:CotS family spore coat protein